MVYSIEPVHWSVHENTVEYAAAEVTHQEQHGSRLALLNALETFGSALYMSGEWGTAEQALRRAADLAVDNPNTQTSRAGLAALLAGRGDHDDATDLILSIERAFVCVEPGPTPRLWLLARRGEVALAAGSATAADDLLAAERAALEIGLRSVRTVRFRRSLVEALVNSGRIEEARGAAERLTVDARRGDVDSAMADADAAEAIVAAAGGDDSR